MKDKFLKIVEYANGVRSVRAARKAEIAKLQAEISRYEKNPDDWSDVIAHTKDKIAKLQEQERAHNQEVYEKLLEMGRELIQLTAEKAKQPLDLEDSKLANALRLAELGKLDYQQASGIAEQFRGNQNALRLLQSTFESKGIHSNINDLIYGPESLEQSLKDQAYHLAWQGGTPEYFQGFMNQFARFEGVDLPKADFSAVTIAAARKAAGLPEAQEEEEKDKTPQP